MLVPITPPPTTTTSAAAGSAAHRRTRFFEEEPEVRRALREAAHEVRVPVGAERRRDEHLVALGCDRALEPRSHAVEHLELEPIARDVLACRERLHLPDDRLVVRCDGDVRALAETALHELEIRTIDVALLRVRDRVGLEVGALHDAEVRARAGGAARGRPACGRGTTAARCRRCRDRHRGGARRCGASRRRSRTAPCRCGGTCRARRPARPGARRSRTRPPRRRRGRGA